MTFRKHFIPTTGHFAYCPAAVFLFFALTLLTAASCRAEHRGQASSVATSRSSAPPAGQADLQKLRQWQAGAVVSRQAVERFGETRCFVADTISNAIFKLMQGKSYKAGCPIPRSKLRYVKVLHINADGNIQLGEIVCHADIASDLVSIFRKLYHAAYPIERMLLIDRYGAEDRRSMEANNTSCFNYRVVAGTHKLSNHSQGRAIDINPLYNPLVKRRKNGTLRVDPEKGRPYANRSGAFRYKISRNDLLYRLFKSHGFIWGGDWRSLKDYQHFEKP